MKISARKLWTARSSILKSIGILFCGLVTSGALTGCASFQPTQWECAAIGGALGATGGAFLGVFGINENNGDHENGVAAGLGGAGVGLVAGGIVGYLACPPPGVPRGHGG